MILLPIEYNRPKQEYYFLPNTEQEYETKFEILLRELFQNSVD